MRKVRIPRRRIAFRRTRRIAAVALVSAIVGAGSRAVADDLSTGWIGRLLFRGNQALQDRGRTPPPELEFGPEWTFTNEYLLALNAAEQERFVDDVDAFMRSRYNQFLRYQDGRQIDLRTYMDAIAQRFEALGRPLAGGAGLRDYRILLPRSGDDFIRFKPDPGVIEVTAKHRNLRGLTSEYLGFVQRFVFDFLAEVPVLGGLRPHDRDGGGHVNVARSSFKSKTTLLNFIYDVYDRPSLFHGALGDYDSKNARDVVDPDRRNWMVQNLEEWVLMDRAGEIPWEGLDRLAESRSADVAYALVDRGAQEDRLELRFLRPQKSAREYYLLCALFQARASYLHRVFGNVVMPSPFSRPATVPGPEEVVWEFAQYVVESGLDYYAYEAEILPRRLRELSQRLVSRSPGAMIRQVEDWARPRQARRGEAGRGSSSRACPTFFARPSSG